MLNHSTRAKILRMRSFGFNVPAIAREVGWTQAEVKRFLRPAKKCHRAKRAMLAEGFDRRVVEANF